MESDEFTIRLNMLRDSQDLFRKWDAVIDELIISTYPSINTNQCTVLRCIISVIWDIGFSNASYLEVVYRLRENNKQLFPTTKSITETIRELCRRKIMISKLITYEAQFPDGTIRESRSRVLEIPDEFRIECLHAMSEVLESSVSGYLLPEKK